MSRRIILPALAVLAAIGAFLVFTGSSGDSNLEEVVTGEGLVIDIPIGWTPDSERSFEFLPPPGIRSPLDRFTVARACGPEGCEVRSIEEWLAIGETLQTFSDAHVVEDLLLFDLTDEWVDDVRVITARTSAGIVQVYVAAFRDGADFYVECGLTQGETGIDLTDAIVKSCRGARAEG